MSPGRRPADLRRLRAGLVRWYRKSCRDLPWRRSRDPYAIWISEVMLQQTRVEAALPYYARFLARFPDAASLAAADVEQVLAEWSGLGYYRRARALHAAARRIVERHGGRLPDDPGELAALPGVGRYTAGAIASIAFDRPTPVVDGNVRRVLCRLEAWSGRRGSARQWELAARLARGPEPGLLNQALMELGALVCLPVEPRCGACPLRGSCRARSSGNPARYPAPVRRKRTERARVAVAWVRRGRRVLLERPADGNPLRGAWDLPAVEIDPRSDGLAAIAAKLGRLGLTAEVGPALARVSHGILHRRLTLEVTDCRRVRGSVARAAELRWVDGDELGTVAVSGATRKVAAAVVRASAPGAAERIR